VLPFSLVSTYLFLLLNREAEAFRTLEARISTGHSHSLIALCAFARVDTKFGTMVDVAVNASTVTRTFVGYPIAASELTRL
jgi:hypothetical protein